SASAYSRRSPYGPGVRGARRAGSLRPARNRGEAWRSRSAQGVGAALLSPAAMWLITTLFQGPDRNKALGVWAAIGGAGSAIGVLLGGVLVSGPGWEWIFFINIPVGLVAFLGVPALLGDARARTGPSGVAPRLDVAGAVTLTAAPALLIYGLVQAREHGFGAMGAWLPLLVALACVTAFVAVERSVREPLVRLELLARRSLVGGGLVMLAASGLLISSFFLNSFYLQHVLGYSALRTGLISATSPYLHRLCTRCDTVGDT
ncbi:MFS transporter, partial [Actinacidiphila soli]|uniref:MFS transporter n=1 Tax=Actinacidiphila soli TaxID=2487275 RepID=UPI000FCB09FF